MNLSSDTIRIAILCAVATWGILEAIKPFVWKFSADSWQKTTVRFAALCIGAAFGWCLDMSAQGAMVGLAGAALSATIVGVLKGRIGGSSS